jgi:hypothetical protein
VITDGRFFSYNSFSAIGASSAAHRICRFSRLSDDSIGSLPVFECANGDEPRYDVRVLSEKGGLVRSSSGLSVDTEALGDPSFDTLII